MRLTDIGFPRMQVVDGGDTVHILVGAHGDGLLVSTPAEANRLADELRKAAWYLEEREMQKRDALDRAAARHLNALRAEVNAETGTLPPPFTSSPAVTERRVVHIPLTEEAS